MNLCTQKQLKFLKQKLVNKSKLPQVYVSHLLDNNKNDNIYNDFNLNNGLSSFNPKFADTKVDAYSNTLDPLAGKILGGGSNLSPPYIG